MHKACDTFTVEWEVELSIGLILDRVEFERG